MTMEMKGLLLIRASLVLGGVTLSETFKNNLWYVSAIGQSITKQIFTSCSAE